MSCFLWLMDVIYYLFCLFVCFAQSHSSFTRKMLELNWDVQCTAAQPVTSNSVISPGDQRLSPPPLPFLTTPTPFRHPFSLPPSPSTLFSVHTHTRAHARAFSVFSACDYDYPSFARHNGNAPRCAPWHTSSLLLLISSSSSSSLGASSSSSPS